MKTVVKIILVGGILGAGAVGAWLYYKKQKKQSPGAAATGTASAAGADTQTASAGTGTPSGASTLTGQDSGIVPADTGGPSYYTPGGAINTFSDELIGNQGPPVIPAPFDKFQQIDMNMLDNYCKIPKYPINIGTFGSTSSLSNIGIPSTNNQDGMAKFLYSKYQLVNTMSLSDFKAAIAKFKGC